MTHEELLEHYKPQLRYDSHEAFFADSAEQMTANSGNRLTRAGGRVIAEGAALTLALLGPSYGEHERAEPSDMLGIQGTDYRDQYSALREARPDLRNRIYGRAKEDKQGRLWLQYWFWYFYNDYHLAANFGLHEGDWEMVQLRMDGDTPEAAVYAQHAFAEERSWADVKKTEDGRPVVYPGRGSHASYFERGEYETEAWFDIADGKRPARELELEVLPVGAEPSWALWPGYWGDSKKHGVAEALEDDSPQGPCRHDEWDDPSALVTHAMTRPRDPRRPPAVRVRDRGGQLWVSFDFAKRAEARPVKLIVTVNSSEEHEVQPKTFTLDVEELRGGQLDTRIRLNPKHHYDIHTSVTLRVDGRDAPTESLLTFLVPGFRRKIPPWLARPIWAIQRLFER